MKTSRDILGAVLLLLSLFAGASGQGATNATIPTITIPPQSQFVLVGTNVTFSVIAAGSAPLKYQWFQNETPLAGETNSSMVVSNVSAGSRGFYHVLVRNAAGVVGSQTAYLIPYTTPATNSGGTVRFTTRGWGVDAPATGAYGRLSGDQWAAQLYAGPPDVSESMLEPLSPPAALRSGSLSGYVVNDGLRFVPSVSPGGLASFQVRAWNINDGDTWEETLRSWNDGMGMSAIITIATGTDENSATPLTGLAAFGVGPPGSPVSIQPTNQIAFLGGTATFTVETRRWNPQTGTYGTNQGPFRWKRNGIVLTNAISPSLVITNVNASDAGTYNVAYFDSPWIESPPYSLTVRFDPQILSIVRTSPSSADLVVRGVTGATLTLLISSNLTTWTPLESLECTTGAVQFVDHSIPPDGQRFYRAASE